MARFKQGIALCGVKGSSGRACRLPAGWGTEHEGVGPCRYHEGKAAGGRYVPLVALADEGLRPLVTRLIEQDMELFDLRYELAVLRAVFARESGKADARQLAELARAIAAVAAKLREMEVGKHYYVHVNVVGLVLRAVGEVVAQYLPERAEREAFSRDLQSSLRGLLPATTATGVAASVLAGKVVGDDSDGSML